jgi:GTP diphosphokinase / guanosine-3',5'-bis(diphosphate) 3'-diphosphatase
MNLRLEARDAGFHTYIADIEVHDLGHLTKIVAALRAADAVVQANRF